MTPRNRGFVMVSETVHEHYQLRWREINREWRGAEMTVDTLGIQSAIDAARDELRGEIRMLATRFPGPYLVPV